MTMAEPDIFSLTQAGLEAGLHVRHVATIGLQCCAPADDLNSILGAPAFRDFDHIPVSDGTHIVGVVERGAARKKGGAWGAVGEHMRPLDGSLLISAGAPLMRFIHLAAESRYRLVVTEAGIEGIVTRSDLLKLPVRVLVFTLVTHLEMVMVEAIRARYPANDDWLGLLVAARRADVEEKWHAHREQRLDPSRLEFTDFCDKRTIVKKAYGLPGRFEKDLKAIEKLRNTVAHAGDYADSENALRRLSQNLELTGHWIEEVQRCAQTPAGIEDAAQGRWTEAASAAR